MSKMPSNVYQVYGLLIGAFVDLFIHFSGMVGDIFIPIFFVVPGLMVVISSSLVGYWREKILGRKLDIKTRRKYFQEIIELSRGSESNKKKLLKINTSIKLMVLSGGFLCSNIIYLWFFYKAN